MKSSPAFSFLTWGRTWSAGAGCMFPARRARAVILSHAETLKPDGSLYTANLRGARQTDTYILKGDGEEVWEPRFTSHGFRYVEVTGFPGKPDLDSIEGRVVNDDLPTAGEFETFQSACSIKFIAPSSGACAEIIAASRRIVRNATSARAGSATVPRNRAAKVFCSTTPRFTPAGCRTSPTRNAPAAACRTSRPPTGRFIPTMSSWPSTLVIMPEMLRDQFDDTRTIARQL